MATGQDIRGEYPASGGSIPPISGPLLVGLCVLLVFAPAVRAAMRRARASQARCRLWQRATTRRETAVGGRWGLK